MSRAAIAIMPSDDGDLPADLAAVYVGEGGDLVCRFAGAKRDVLIVGLRSGTLLDPPPVAIRATGTTAAQLVGVTV